MFLVNLTLQMRVKSFTYFLLFFFAIVSVASARNERTLLHTSNFEKTIAQIGKDQNTTKSEIRAHNHNHESIDHVNNTKFTALLPDHFHYKVELVENEIETEENTSKSYDSDIINTINFSKLYLTFLRELDTNNSSFYRDHSQTNNLLDTLFIVYRVIRL